MTMTTNRRGDAQSRKDRRPAAGLLTGARRAATGSQQPRHRSWGLVTLAALLVIGLGLGVAAWGLQVGDKSSVLAIGRPVAKGQVIERGDLFSESVAGVGESIAVERIDSVVGQSAGVDLVAGQILIPAMLATEPLPGQGQSLVGLALDPARVPSAGLEPGDRIDVIAVPGADGAPGQATALSAPDVLAPGAGVYAVGGESTVGGLLLLTVVVDAEDAAMIAVYSTANRIAVVETAPTPGTATDAPEGSGESGASTTPDPDPETETETSTETGTGSGGGG